MKKKILYTALALMLIATGFMGVKGKAEAATQSVGWDVTYNGSGFDSTYDVSKSTITSTMPGDTIVFKVNYYNATKDAAEFYLSTDIINSLEEKSIGGGSSNAAGGAYSYKLAYTINGTDTVIYDSETIGGDNDVVAGLKQVQGQAGDGSGAYFNIGKLASDPDKKNPGTVTIEISLDGNSQDNSYMAKLATLDVRFGAEKVEEETVKNTTVNKVTNHTGGGSKVVYTTPGGTQVVYIEEPATPLANPITGDSLLPLVLCTAAMLTGIILIALYFIISKKQREEVA